MLKILLRVKLMLSVFSIIIIKIIIVVIIIKRGRRELLEAKNTFMAQTVVRLSWVYKYPPSSSSCTHWICTALSITIENRDGKSYRNCWQVAAEGEPRVSCMWMSQQNCVAFQEMYKMWVEGNEYTGPCETWRGSSRRSGSIGAEMCGTRDFTIPTMDRKQLY